VLFGLPCRTPYPMNLRSLPRVLSAITAAAFAGLPAHAETYTWLPKESAGPGLTYTWNLADNWSAPEFSYPMIAGDVANLNNNIEAAQTIDLNQSITIGVLNFGDEDGSHAFTLNSGLFGDALILDSGVVGMAAQINLSSAAKPINTINAPLILGTA
jgi:hypothetical protein